MAQKKRPLKRSFQTAGEGINRRYWYCTVLYANDYVQACISVPKKLFNHEWKENPRP